MAASHYYNEIRSLQFFMKNHSTFIIHRLHFHSIYSFRGIFASGTVWLDVLRRRVYSQVVKTSFFFVQIDFDVKKLSHQHHHHHLNFQNLTLCASIVF